MIDFWSVFNILGFVGILVFNFWKEKIYFKKEKESGVIIQNSGSKCSPQIPSVQLFEVRPRSPLPSVPLFCAVPYDIFTVGFSVYSVWNDVTSDDLSSQPQLIFFYLKIIFISNKVYLISNAFSGGYLWLMQTGISDTRRRVKVYQENYSKIFWFENFWSLFLDIESLKGDSKIFFVPYCM